MPVDTSMYQAAVGPEKSLADYQQQYQGIAQNALNLQRSKQQLDAYTQDQAEKASLRNYLASSPDLSTAQGYNGLMAAAPTLGPSIHKSYQESITSAALANKDNAQAGNFNAETQTKQYDLARQKLDRAMQMVSQSPTPDVAKQHLTELVQHGLMSMQDATAKAQEIDQASAQPGGYNQWRLGSMAQLMSAHDQFEANKPTLGTRNTGNTIQNTATDPMTGVPTVTATTPLQATPGEVLTARTAGAQLAETKRHNQVSEGVETVKADPFGTLGFNKTAPAGLGAASTMSGDQYLATLPPSVANQVKMLAEGRMPITAMSARSPQMMALLNMASQYEPGTDATTYVQRAQTVKDFAPGGKDGQAITNLNTAIHHAGQLSDAIDKLDNSNVLPGITNPVENFIGQKALGQTTQGVYKQKADALASELRKVYAGGGGGSLSELNEWQKSFDGNASKEQQKAYLQSGMELLVGALQAKKDAYQRGMGSRAQFGDLLSPESKSVLSRLAPDYAATIGGAPAAATAVVPAANPLFKLTHVDGRPVQ